MFHATLPIGVAETPRGILVSLPPRFWLVVSLRRAFPRLLAEAEAWTYRVPGPGAAAKVERWIAEVELRLRAEGRRRAWTATDAEWLGLAAPAPAAAPFVGPSIVFSLPKTGVAKSTLKLLERMAAGAWLAVTVGAEGRTYALCPSGRPVRASVVERAIRDRFVVPGGDGLLGPEWSQTWHLAPEAP